jgi:hypothetical protein
MPPEPDRDDENRTVWPMQGPFDTPKRAVFVISIFYRRFRRGKGPNGGIEDMRICRGESGLPEKLRLVVQRSRDEQVPGQFLNRDLCIWRDVHLVTARRAELVVSCC